jgi:hypothetical protein
MGHRVWDQVVTLNVGFMERLQIINGLIRQYLPKETGLSVHSQEDLYAIAPQLNMRPRKRFDFKCPIEEMGQVMQESMAVRHDDPSSIQ